MNGIFLLSSNIPPFVLSSSKDFEMRKASTLGAVDYWIKSNVSLQEICDRVDRLLRDPVA